MRIWIYALLMYLYTIIPTVITEGLYDEPHTIEIIRTLYGYIYLKNINRLHEDLMTNVTCTNCENAIIGDRLKCRPSKSLHLQIQFTKDNRRYNISRNVTCSYHGYNRHIVYMHNTSTQHSISIQMSASSLNYEMSTNKHFIIYMDSDLYYNKPIITDRSSHVFDNLNKNTSYRICAAHIDNEWKTGIYTCSNFLTDSSVTGPVVDFTLHLSYDTTLSWKKPQYELNNPNGYLFNFLRADGDCRTIISNGSLHTNGYNCSENATVYKMSDLRLNIDFLRPNTNYTVDIYPISKNKTSKKATINFQTRDGESESVSSLSTSRSNMIFIIKYDKPSQVNGLLIGYKVVVYLTDPQLCAQINDIFYESTTTDNIVNIPLYLFKKCVKYRIEVSPVNRWRRNNGVGKMSTIKYRHEPGPIYNITHINAKFVQQNMIQISWNDSRSEGHCDDPGYIFEVADSVNQADCVTYIFIRQTCDIMKEAAHGRSNCTKRQYASIANTDRTVYIAGNFKLSVQYRIKVWTIIGERIVLDPLTPMYINNTKSRKRYLDIRRMFNNLILEDRNVTFRILPDGVNNKTSLHNNGDNTALIECEVGEISHIMVEFTMNNNLFNIPLNISCAEDDSASTIKNITRIYSKKVINLTWNDTTNEDQMCIVYWMNKYSYWHKYLTKYNRAFSIENVTEEDWYQICIATINSDWVTSKYTCIQHSLYVQPVNNLTVSSSTRDMTISWQPATHTEIIYHGYIVNITDATGRCQTTIINLKTSCIKVKEICPFPQIIQWEYLQPFHVRGLLHNTQYSISISAVHGKIIGTKRITVVTTDREETVHNITVSPRQSFVLVQFVVPRDSESIALKYRLKITLSRVNMCTYTNGIIHNSVINVTSKLVSLETRTNCCEYVVEVTPIRQCERGNKIGGTTSVVYKPTTRRLTRLNNTDAIILSRELLKISWSDTLRQDDCSNFGFMVESENTENRSDCNTWILTGRTCTKLVDDLSTLSKCKNKKYLQIHPGIIKKSIIQRGRFEIANTYMVRVWRITDHVEMLFNKLIKYNNVTDCFVDCYSASSSSSYTGIRSGTINGQLCLQWKNFKMHHNTVTNVRSNICHSGNNSSNNIPRCIGDIHGNMVNCDIPKCDGSPQSTKCEKSVAVTSSTDMITIQWPDVSSSTSNIHGYITLLHNTNDECEQYIIMTCTNCIQLLEMSSQVQSFYLSCQSGRVINEWSNRIIFQSLQPNTEYRIFIIPLIDHVSTGLVHNVTIATQVADQQTPSYIDITNRGINFLQFMWHTESRVNSGTNIDYYQATLVNKRSNYKLNNKSKQKMMEFSHLEICTEYCLSLYAINIIGQSEWSDIVCTHTLSPRPAAVSVDDIEHGSSMQRVVSWRYTGNDGCPKYYRLRYTIKYTTQTFDKITNYTTMNLIGLMRNVVYQVKVRTEMSADQQQPEKYSDYSEVKEFFVGPVNPNISNVVYNIDASRKILDISWILSDNSPGAIFEFVVLINKDGGKCSDSINLICDFCVDPHTRKSLNPETTLQLDALLNCERSVQDSFKKNTKFFGTTINSVYTLNKSTMTIYGLNLLGLHKMYEKSV